MALALDTAMRRLGAEDRAFETIVASGPNAAKPHARPTKRAIVAGDPVVVDFGAIFEGYRSDMTRTFCVGGEPSGTLARVFEVVAEAQAAGVAAVRAGRDDGRRRQGLSRRASPTRVGRTLSSTAPGTGSVSTSTRPRRWARGRLLSSPPTSS